MADIGDGERPAGSLLEGLVAAMPDAVVGTDAEFRVIVWNAGAERLYGYTEGEALGRFARELATLVGDISHVELEEALARDGRVQGKLRARRGDGTIVDLEVFISRVHDPPGYVGIHRDVTDRPVAELDRRRLAAIVSVLVRLHRSGRPRGAPAVPQRRRPSHGRAGLDGRGPSHRDCGLLRARGARAVVDEYLPNILAHGREAWELTLQHFETGDRIPVSYDRFRVDDPETGEPLALATIMRDLTERRRLDTILAAVTDGIYAVDVGLRFTYVNDEAIEVMAQMLGRPLRRSDFLGRAVFDLFPGVKDELEALYRAPLGGTASRFEFDYEPEGRCFDNSAYPLAGGGIRGVLPRHHRAQGGRPRARAPRAPAGGDRGAGHARLPRRGPGRPDGGGRARRGAHARRRPRSGHGVARGWPERPAPCRLRLGAGYARGRRSRPARPVRNLE